MQYTYKPTGQKISINRNIVECKAAYSRLLINQLAVLIETLWNVKSDRTVKDICREFSINRNIVECKEHIRIILISGKRVLIETLWNVKVVGNPPELLLELVLIETLWNVKRSISGVAQRLSSINRNIVECKGRINSFACCLKIGINRNIVECKEIFLDSG